MMKMQFSKIEILNKVRGGRDVKGSNEVERAVGGSHNPLPNGYFNLLFLIKKLNQTGPGLEHVFT